MQMGIAMAGGLVGSLFGMPQMGFMAGSLLGSLFGSRQKKQDNRLGDVRVAASTYGTGVPRVWGTMLTAGNIIWATDIVERPKDDDKKGSKFGGKGASAKGAQNYEAFGNFAVAICEGEVEDVLRIWLNDELIFDKLGKGQYYAPGSKPKALLKKEAKEKAKRLRDPRLQPRIYYGTKDQTPDPMIASAEGQQYTPGYRGLCYMVWEMCPLDAYGKHIPNVKVEVVMKKRMLWSCQAMSRLPQDQRYCRGGEATYCVVDYARRRLITQNQGWPYDGGVNGRIIWDIQEAKELVHIPNDDPAHMDVNLCTTPDGSIVTKLAPWGNSGPIGLLDPVTYKLKKSFGHYGNSIDNTMASIATPSLACAHSPFLEPTIDEMGVTARTWQLFTLGYFNQAALFDSQLDYVWGTGRKLPKWPSGRLCPGPFNRKTGSVTWYCGANYSPDSHAALYEFKTNVYTQIDLKGFEEDVQSSYVPYPDGNLLWTFNAADYGSQYIWVSGIFYDITTQTTCVILSGSGGTAGVMYRAVMMGTLADGSFGIKWETSLDAWPGGHKVESYGIMGKFAFMASSVYATAIHVLDFVNQTYKVIYAPDGGFAVGAPMQWGDQFYFPQIDAILVYGYTANPELIQQGGGNNYNWFIIYYDQRTQETVGLDEIVTDLCLDVGIRRADIDVIELKNTQVSGYILDNPMSARSSIEELSKGFLFDGCESDYILKFRMRGKSPVGTINQDECGAVDDSTKDWYRESRIQEVDLPMRLTINYHEIWKDYQNNTQYWKRVVGPRQTMQSRQQDDFTLNVASHPDQIKQMAQKMVNSSWAERSQHAWKLPWNYILYDPTDVLTFTSNDGLVFNERLLKIDMGADYSLAVQSISQDPASYLSTASGSMTYFDLPSRNALPNPAVPIILDTPLLLDHDDTAAGARFYVGASAYASEFDGADIALSTNGDDYTLIADSHVTTPMAWGVVDKALPVPAGGCFATDTKTEIEITIAYKSAEWSVSNLTDEEFLEGLHNAVLIGDEIIIFRDVAISDSGQTVRLSNLQRGRRGTEWAAFTHRDSEAAVFLDGSLIGTTAPLDYIGRDIWFKAVAPGLTFSTSPTVRKVFKGNALKPYAPRPFSRQDKTNGDVILSWSRRSRFSAPMMPGTGITSVGEEFEKYDLYLLSAPFDPKVEFDPTNPASFKRKFEGLTTPTVTYTAAMQAADGYNAALDPLYAVVFQLSAKIGKGFPGWGTTWRFKVT